MVFNSRILQAVKRIPALYRTSMGNRRNLPRYDVTHRSLVVKCGSNILRLLNISQRGLCLRADEAFLNACAMEDVLHFSLIDQRESFNFEAKIVHIRHASNELAIELVRSEAQFLAALNYLIYPQAVGKTMTVEEIYVNDSQGYQKIWYHGDKGTSLHLFKNLDGKIISWRLVSRELYIGWDIENKLRTGLVSPLPEHPRKMIDIKDDNLIIDYDSIVESFACDFAQDLLTSAQIDDKEKVLKILSKERPYHFHKSLRH